jgi:hypothetical protein
LDLEALLNGEEPRTLEEILHMLSIEEGAA